MSENTTSSAPPIRAYVLLLCGVLTTTMACGSDSDSADDTRSPTPDATSGADDSGATDGTGTSTGALTWSDAIVSGHLRASGERSDLSAYLPLA